MILKFPFEATLDEIKSDPDPYISSVFFFLESDFLAMPKGKGFIEYSVFEQGYEGLKRVTENFSRISPPEIFIVIQDRKSVV